MKKYIAIIAPGHKKYDERVLRTVREYSKFINVIYVHERESHFDEIEKTAQGYSVVNVQFPLPDEYGLIARYKKIKLLNKRLKEFNIVGYHVHESGTFGLNIISSLPGGKKIFFDYHDWIPFEIQEKVGSGLTYNLVYLFFRKVYIKTILRKLTAVVFISDGAKEYFIKFYGNIKSFVVPNSRKILENEPLLEKELLPLDKDNNNLIELLWVGNVMPLRQIERLFDIREHLMSSIKRANIKISIWGRIKDDEYAEKIKNIEKQSLNKNEESYLIFNGSYQSETEIIPLKNYYTFGISFGWKEKVDTGLNKISCPTKMYSYGLINIIGLLENKCEDQNTKLRNAKLDLGFSDEKEICSKILHYMYNPMLYIDDSVKLNSFCTNQNIESEDEIRKLVKSMLS
jgi:glycosyltransferase involved in cell wall biosynthesis